MTVSNMFSFNRTAALMRKDAYEYVRPALVALGAVFGAFLVIYVIAAYVAGSGSSSGVSAGSESVEQVLFSVLLFLGGVIVTSRAFYEVHNKTRNHDWLMVPASPVEKVVSRLFPTSVGYAAAVLVFMFVFSAVAAGVTRLVFGMSFPLFNPVSKTSLWSVLNYLIVQSMFLLGAAYFRKHHLIKAVLVMTAAAIVLTIIVAVAFRLAYAGYFSGIEPNEQFIRFFESFDTGAYTHSRLEELADVLTVVGKVIYWALVAPVCWFVAYLRVKEAEVKDGV